MQNLRTVGLILKKVRDHFNLTDKHGKIIQCGRVTRRKYSNEILTVTFKLIRVKIAHLSYGCHEPARWDPPSDVVVVWPHPKLLQQVDVVVGLVDKVANGRHPQLFVLSFEYCMRHSPGVE